MLLLAAGCFALSGRAADGEGPPVLSKETMAHLRSPERSMGRATREEIARVTRHYFAPVLRAAMGPTATFEIHPNTTLAGVRDDRWAKHSEIALTCAGEVSGKSGRPAKLSLFIEIYFNDALTEHYREQFAYHQKQYEKWAEREPARRRRANEQGYAYEPYVLRFGFYPVVRERNGYKWFTPDGRMRILVRNLDGEMGIDDVARRARKIHHALTKAGLYAFPRLIFSHAAANSAVAGLSEEAAEARANRLVHVLREWEKENGVRLVYEPTASALDIAFHLKDEDGSRKPIRSGQEVAFYDRLKEYMANRSSDSVLKPEDVLVMALDVTPRERGKRLTMADTRPAGEEEVNVFLAFMTTHNVLRLLARPEQWHGSLAGDPLQPGDYGHPPTDPAYPILEDIYGIGSTGGRSLPELSKHLFTFRDKPETEHIDDVKWSVKLYGPNGVFQIQPGSGRAPTSALQDHWNGGCTYYYWVGALAEPSLGKPGVWYAGWKETKVKEQSANAERAKVQMTHFYGGAAFGKKARTYVKQDQLLDEDVLSW